MGLIMKNGFLKFVVVILTFFALLLLSDRGVAVLEDELYSRKDTKINYVNRTDVADVVIFGSSRASHHYIPQILADSLNMTCVNLGEDGQGILYNYPLAHRLLEKHTPKVVIYEFGGQDWSEGIGDNIEPLSIVYGRNDVYDNVVNEVKPNLAKVVGVFSSYRYNTRLHKVLLNDYETSAPLYGYEPLYGNKKDGVEIKQLTPNVIDDYKVSIIKAFIEECKNKGVLLIGVASPRYAVGGIEEKELLESILNEYSVPYFDYMEATFDAELFVDASHLNDKGAKWFTPRIASDIKQVLQQCEF